MVIVRKVRPKERKDICGSRSDHKSHFMFGTDKAKIVKARRNT